MPYIEDWTLERKRLEAQFLRSSECIAYLALENGTVAGFIGLKKKLYGSYMILNMMHVSADYRGKGIGDQLIDIYFGICKGMNFNKCFIAVSDFNPRAKALYQKKGFKLLLLVPDLLKKGIGEWLLMKNL